MPSFHVNAKWAAISELSPGFYISGVCALNPKTLADLDINLIINCTKEVPNLNIKTNCERIKLWLDDTEETDLSAHFDTVCDRIRFALDCGHRVLIHCVAGVSRSAAFCLVYLMKFERLSLRRAYRFMTIRRPVVRPNLGFWRQLIDYERALRPDRPPSVRIVNFQGPKDEDKENFEIPDVYVGFFKDGAMEEEENKENDSNAMPFPTNIDLLGKRRHSSGGAHTRFVPRLASVPEN